MDLNIEARARTKMIVAQGSQPEFPYIDLESRSVKLFIKHVEEHHGH